MILDRESRLEPAPRDRTLKAWDGLLKGGRSERCERIPPPHRSQVLLDLRAAQHLRDRDAHRPLERDRPAAARSHLGAERLQQAAAVLDAQIRRRAQVEFALAEIEIRHFEDQLVLGAAAGIAAARLDLAARELDRG